LKKLFFVFTVIFFLFFSCKRGSDNNPLDTKVVSAPSLVNWSGAYPQAILKPGENPLWFLVTQDGPIHIGSLDEISRGSIEDEIFFGGLIPWTHAIFISSMSDNNGEIIMTVNRDGFLKLKPEPEEIALYYFPGGEIFNQHTVGGFVFFKDDPVALIYSDDRFLDSDSLSLFQPFYGTWSFNMNSNIPFPVEIPALNFYPGSDNWIIDTLRKGDDDFFYYRAARRNNSRQEISMLRTANLSHAGVVISLDLFQNSAPHKEEIFHTSLPALPENFYYTGICYIKDCIIASWEEQIDYSIGAAGFVLIEP